MDAHRETYREILHCTEQAAVAAERGEIERLAECLRRRQELMEAVESLPPLDPKDRVRLRGEALPLLDAALRMNRRIIALLTLRRTQLARFLAGDISRFVDTWG
ncbi:MAG: hypothetical protein N0A24_07160 [Armatimonadetes bacterium]|nr:hypothetical protein [Armatimonadota bacterium]MDW8153980.1 flagellar protein FliT [Armatimonadota bacterium]